MIGSTAFLCAIAFFDTGNSSERISRLRITQNHSEYAPQTVFSQDIDVIEGDQIVFLSAYGEATNPYKYNVMLGHNVEICDDKTCDEITEKKATNITPSQHHLVWIDAGSSYRIKKSGSYKIKQNLYSASSASDGDDHLIIEKDYGRMSLMIMRECGQEITNVTK